MKHVEDLKAQLNTEKQKLEENRQKEIEANRKCKELEEQMNSRDKKKTEVIFWIPISTVFVHFRHFVFFFFV